MAGCSSSVDRADLVESYQQSRPDATAVETECVVDRLVEAFGIEGVEAELTATTGPTRAFELETFRAEFGCGRTDDVQAQLSELLAERELATDDAECVAEALTASLDEADLEVLIGGEMTDAFFDKYFVAVEGCGALPG